MGNQITPPPPDPAGTGTLQNIDIPISPEGQARQGETPPPASTTHRNETWAMEQGTHTRANELSDQLDELQGELSRAERSVDILRRARSGIYAEITREKHGIAPGDLVSWEGERRGRNSQRSRPLTLRGVVVAVPMRDRLQIRRLNRHGKPMDQTVYVPVDCVELTAGT